MRKAITSIVITVLLLSAVLVLFNWKEIQLNNALDRYNRMLDGQLPENLELTIYYLPHHLETRAILSTERLMSMDDTVRIVVTSEELANHVQTLRQLDTSAVQVSEEDCALKARIYYVFKTDDRVLLEVVMQQFVGDDQMFGAFVNGIHVRKSSKLYEIILPFLSESDCEEMGLVIETGS